MSQMKSLKCTSFLNNPNLNEHICRSWPLPALGRDIQVDYEFLEVVYRSVLAIMEAISAL